MKHIVSNMEDQPRQVPLGGPQLRSNDVYGHKVGECALGTFSGLIIDPRALELDKINIEDIAHSLSMQCRFGGHVTEFYSVAQHSVEVSNRVDKTLALWGLLHDASEAYVCDLPRPIKSLFPEYSKLEREIQERIAARFSLPFPIPAEIKRADTIELLTEAKRFHNTPIFNGSLEARSIDGMISLAPAFAKKQFLDRFEELINV